MPPDFSDDDHKSAMRNQIDENLRRVYTVALEDEVPERFRILLQQLREAATAQVPTAPAPDGPMQVGVGASGTGMPQTIAETGT